MQFLEIFRRHLWTLSFGESEQIAVEGCNNMDKGTCGEEVWRRERERFLCLKMCNLVKIISVPPIRSDMENTHKTIC